MPYVCFILEYTAICGVNAARMSEWPCRGGKLAKWRRASGAKNEDIQGEGSRRSAEAWN